MIIRTLAMAVFLAGLSACNLGTREPVTVTELRLPLDKIEGIARIEDKSVYVDTYGDGDELPVPAQALRNQGITSSAYYKYWTIGEISGAYKVKMNVYADRAALEADWARRYPPAALQDTTPLALGDGGFQYGDKVAVFHAANVMVEIQAAGGVRTLDEFLDVYGAYVLDQLD